MIVARKHIKQSTLNPSPAAAAGFVAAGLVPKGGAFAPAAGFVPKGVVVLVPVPVAGAACPSFFLEKLLVKLGVPPVFAPPPNGFGLAPSAFGFPPKLKGFFFSSPIIASEHPLQVMPVRIL